MAQQLQNDDNLVPGQTYTFTFQNQNWVLVPSGSTLQDDLVKNAPNFLGSLQVSMGFQPSLADPLATVATVQFTYSGDGSDVVSDVAASMVAAFQSGSGDSLSFLTAFGAAAANVPSLTQNTLSTITTAAGQVAAGVTSAAAGAAQNLLTPVEIALGIVVILTVVLIFTIGKSGGLKTPALSIG